MHTSDTGPVPVGDFVTYEPAPSGAGRASIRGQGMSESMVTFIQLNDEWNADPNGPKPSIETDGSDVLLTFYVNCYEFDGFTEEDIGILRFRRCQRYRLGSPNDEGWYRGQGRFDRTSHEWGEFYLLDGADNVLDDEGEWHMVDGMAPKGNHYLFYFRDNTFECIAAHCDIEPSSANALYREGKQLRTISDQ